MNYLGWRNDLVIKNKVGRMDTSVNTELLGCEYARVQHKNQFCNKKKGKLKLLQFLPSYLLASSALFRSLSGRESSQSSIVLISFPLIE